MDKCKKSINAKEANRESVWAWPKALHMAASPDTYTETGWARQNDAAAGGMEAGNNVAAWPVKDI